MGTIFHIIHLFLRSGANSTLLFTVLNLSHPLDLRENQLSVISLSSLNKEILLRSLPFLYISMDESQHQTHFSVVTAFLDPEIALSTKDKNESDNQRPYKFMTNRHHGNEGMGLQTQFQNSKQS